MLAAPLESNEIVYVGEEKAMIPAFSASSRACRPKLQAQAVGGYKGRVEFARQGKTWDLTGA